MACLIPLRWFNCIRSSNDTDTYYIACGRNSEQLKDTVHGTARPLPHTRIEPSSPKHMVTSIMPPPPHTHARVDIPQVILKAQHTHTGI